MNAQALPQRHRITVEEYGQMGRAGIFNEDDRIELIEGEIFDMGPIGTKHAECVCRLARAFIRSCDATVRIQDPATLATASEPQPDVAVVLTGNYSNTHPGPGDILLLIEVADSSLDYDRPTKVPIYARHGIPEVWLIDLAAECIEVYRDPDFSGYQCCQTLKRGEHLEPALLAGVALAVPELLP